MLQSLILWQNNTRSIVFCLCNNSLANGLNESSSVLNFTTVYFIFTLFGETEMVLAFFIPSVLITCLRKKFDVVAVSAIIFTPAGRMLLSSPIHAESLV